jgi:hypothetical protein
MHVKTVENLFSAVECDECRNFTHGKNSLMNQGACGFKLVLRTILSTKYVQNFPIAGTGTRVRCLPDFCPCPQ